MQPLACPHRNREERDRYIQSGLGRCPGIEERLFRQGVVNTERSAACLPVRVRCAFLCKHVPAARPPAALSVGARHGWGPARAHGRLRVALGALPLHHLPRRATGEGGRVRGGQGGGGQSLGPSLAPADQQQSHALSIRSPSCSRRLPGRPGRGRWGEGGGQGERRRRARCSGPRKHSTAASTAQLYSPQPLKPSLPTIVSPSCTLPGDNRGRQGGGQGCSRASPVEAAAAHASARCVAVRRHSRMRATLN